jgi:NAD(P)-dependent dehydrogenase (short-subunit alcohol dehydrogenase family)
MAALQGKITSITGASRGTGRVTASALAEAGAHLLIVDERPAHVWR